MSLNKLFLARQLLALVVSVGMGLSGALYAADSMKDVLFTDLEAKFEEAKAVNAKQLSPENYESALEAYHSALSRLEKGHNLDRIKRDIQASGQHLSLAMKAAELAEATFTTVQAARKDAIAADAQNFATKEWEIGEEQFDLAIRRLEKGSIKRATSAAEEAQLTYRAAELAAIKGNYLSDARVLIKKADKEKIDRVAPITLEKARALLNEAETSLSENRYDIDQPRSLARQAQYEAKHAFKIAEQVTPVIKKKVSAESLVLALEDPVVRIASSLDLTPKLDGSVEDPIRDILVEIAQLRKSEYELQERTQELAALEKQISGLEARLGLQSERLAIQEANRRKLKKIESMFTDSEAQVMKKGDSILIRLVGLNFRSGLSTIDSGDFALLKKVEAGMNIYPDAQVIIEGHTDSFGSDASNYTLSEQRAQAVRQYLLANMSSRSPSSIESVGFGETRPIGNNENAEGREKNRRIDLVIRVTGGL